MKKQADHGGDSSLRETMIARIEINELGDPVHQSKIAEAVMALNGVIESKTEKGALHVSYDPLATTQKKIEQAVRSTGNTVKAVDTGSETPHLPTRTNVGQASSKTDELSQ